MSFWEDVYNSLTNPSTTKKKKKDDEVTVKLKASDLPPEYRQVLDEASQHQSVKDWASSVTSTVGTLSPKTQVKMGTQKVSPTSFLTDTPAGYRHFDTTKDVAPKKPKEESLDVSPLDFLSKGTLEDGYQMWDILKGIGTTAQDAGANIVYGAGKAVEGIADAGMYLFNAGAKAGNYLSKNTVGHLYDKIGIDTEKLYGNADKQAEFVKSAAQLDVMDHLMGDTLEELDEGSFLGETSDAVGQGVGNVAFNLATGAIGKGVGLAGEALSWFNTATMFTSAFGNGTSEAYADGASDAEAYGYGVISGAAEALSERLFSGQGKLFEEMGHTAFFQVDDLVAKKLTSKISNQTIKNIGQWLIKAGFEGTEEIVAGLGSAFGKWLTYKSDEELSQIIKDENLFEQFVVGFFTSGLTQGGDLIKANKAKTDLVSESAAPITKDEESVIQKMVGKIIEEKGNVSKREEKQIREQVIDQMNKGQISIEDIVETLGGDSLKAYKDNLASEEKTINELRELYQGEELDQQIKDLLSNSKSGEMRSNLVEEVYNLVKGTRLAESFNEVERRFATYQADLSKYDEKQRATIQKAIDSGVLNNTRRTHEFVDMVAKISADKGVLFDFTNNAKLRESGFAVGGKTVNGFVSDGVITLNLQSSKSLNSVVGHEISHVLEGTELYDELQKVLYEYSNNKKASDSKFKSEYVERLYNTRQLYKDVEGYKGVEGHTKIKNEVFADLVGDYLFTDNDFIMNLSTNHRNLFQKIYDEIKYLYKVVTAGSKEAKALEKVKKAFEDAYRADTKTDSKTDARYSLSIKHSDGTVEELADARSLTTDQAVDYLYKARSGELRRDTYVPVRKDTPQVIIDTLNEAGENVDNLSLVMQVRKAQQAMSSENPGNRSKKHGDNVRKHAMTPEEIVNIIDKLDEPNMVILQTNRTDKSGKSLPNNVAVFVEYSDNGNEGLAVIEFENPRESDAIGTEFGDTNYHTVVTVFEPDVEREGMPYDYAEELLSNPNNYELDIKRRQPEGSATGEKHPNTSNELPSYEVNVAQEDQTVNRQFSLSTDSSGVEHSSEMQHAPTFYSQMAKVVDGVKQEKLGAASVVSMLRGKGVKAEEIKWSGIEEFLEGKKSVTKAELQEFVSNSMLNIEESVLDDKQTADVQLKRAGNGKINLVVDGKPVKTFAKNDGMWEDGEGRWFYNKKDLLEWAKKNYSNRTRWGKYVVEDGTNYREILFNMPGADHTNSAMQVHWGKKAKGILAHARVQDLDVNGQKMLFIEEIQSDWHNEGHKEGYIGKGQATESDIRNQTGDAYRDFAQSEVVQSIERKLGQSDYNGNVTQLMSDVFDGNKSAYSDLAYYANLTSEEKAFLDKNIADESKRQESLENAAPDDGTPDAPFRDNYHEFVLKKMLREAAENGYDSIGWTTADIQSNRWSDEFAEGYRIEYDQDIPKFLNKYGKKWGATVGKTTLNNGTEVWSMPITDAMKQSVLHEGQPLYSLSTDSTGKQLSAEQQEYFADSKVRDSNGNLLTVYHTTDSDFTVFDNAKKGANTETYNTYMGFFFSGSDDYMKNFPEFKDGKTTAYYLDMKKPIDMTNMSKQAFLDIVEVTGGDVQEAAEIYDAELQAEQQRANFRGDNDTSLYLSGLLREMVGDYDDAEFHEALKPNFDKLKAKGYDGVINFMDEMAGEKEYIVFDSNQAKLTTNTKPSGDPDIRYSLSVETNDLAQKINESMTMQEARQMIQRAFVLGDVKNWYDDKYKNGDEWLKGEGADDVAMIIENEYALQSAYLDKIQGILDEEFYLTDVLNAYSAGTLTGKIKKQTEKINIADGVIVADKRFYAPQEIDNAKSLYDVANQRLTNSNREDVTKARAAILLYAHNKGAAETLGITNSELNKKLRSWGGYSAKARDISMRINSGAHSSNRWTGIESVSWLNKATVSNDEVVRMVKSVEGSGDDYQNKYIARTMLSLDTHIDWSWLNFKFDTYAGVNSGYKGTTPSGKCNGYYSNSNRLIHVKRDAPNTVAHEMGHALDYQWGRDFGYEYTCLTEIPVNTSRLSGEAKVWFDHFKEFQDSLVASSDIRSEYSMDVKETFARFVAKFVEWTEQIGTGRSSMYESSWYNDKFTGAQFVQFARLLQEKSAIDSRGATENKFSLSNPGETPKTYGNYNVYGKDIALEDSLPIRDDVAAPVAETPADDLPIAETVADPLPDDLPMADEELDTLVQQKESLEDQMLAMSENGDFGDGFYQLNEKWVAVSERLTALEGEIAERDADYMDSFDDADAPPIAEQYNDSTVDVIPITKKLENDIAREVRAKLALGNKHMADVHSIISEYSQSEFPSREQLFEELKDKFGTFTESYTDEDLVDAKKYLRTYGLQVGDYIKREIADYDSLRKQNRYKIRFSDAGTPVDLLYQELNGMYPHLFPESIDVPTDQFMRIVDVANMDKVTEYETALDDESIYDVADTIINAVSEYRGVQREKAANKYGRESFNGLMQDADQYVPPIDYEQVLNKRWKPLWNTEGYTAEAEIYDTQHKKGVAEGQQAMWDDPVPKVITRQSLHEGIVDNAKTKFAERGLDLDEVLKSAKDLSTFATVDNTPQRVMEKALGYKAGQVLSDITVNKVAQNETEGIKWLNTITDRKSGLLAQLSKQYHIAPGSKESAAAMMYAEGFYVNDKDEYVQYGDAELAQDFHNDKVVIARIKGLARDPRVRQFYDDTLASINESRARNAYPEIPRLDNYYLHMRAMDDTFSRLGLPFNPNDIRAKDLPTDLNGVTADLKPGQPYFASAMHRTGKRTSYDLLGGLERYATAAKNQIYHIDDIQTLRALRNYIADTYGQANGLEGLDDLTEEEAQQRIEQVYKSHLSTFAKFLNEEANVLAGKTSLIDRGLEGIIGRRGITFLDTVNQQVGRNMVGFNVSSSLTNFLPVAQTFAKTQKRDFVKAFAQTTASKISSIFGKKNTFAETSPVMIRRKGADSFYRTPYQKVADAGYVFMSAVDDISTELIARTKYNELTRKGMDSQQAHIETDKWVSRLMGDRSLGQQPQLYNSKMLGLFTKFQLEVRNQLDSQFYDTIQETKASTEDIQNGLARNAKRAAKITSTFVQLAVVQHLFGKAFESVAGYNPAFDIIDVLIKTFGWDDDEEDEDTILDNAEEGFLALLEDLPYTSTFTGGRIPISSALPIEQFVTGKDEYGNDVSRWDTFKETAPYYLLPGGYGQLKKSVQGLQMFDDDLPIAGSYTDKGDLRFPVEDTFGNRLQAGLFGQYASANARDYFDNERKPLEEKQIQEFIDVDIPIRDYWDYREGLSDYDKLADKADYIDSLDLPTSKKNILINNIADRKDPIDMMDYGKYGSFEEFDFAEKNQAKYSILQENGITYDQYKAFDDHTKDYFSWATKYPEKYTVSKAVSSDFLEYCSYRDELSQIDAKDASGQTVSGLKKERTIEYINNLPLDYGQKAILYRSLYDSKSDRANYNADILEYLNGRSDISYEDKVTILEELDFKVYADGTVKWD